VIVSENVSAGRVAQDSRPACPVCRRARSRERRGV